MTALITHMLMGWYIGIITFRAGQREGWGFWKGLGMTMIGAVCADHLLKIFTGGS